MSEESLSDKISKSEHPFHVPTLFVKDVREAVRKLKEEISKYSFEQEFGYEILQQIIDKIFGEKLT